MLMHNPYTNGYVDYPLDLSRRNVVLDYYITHETFFCPTYSTWSVIHLYSGDIVYLPYGDRNRRDIYVVTYYYRTKQVSFPYGVYTIKYSAFMQESELLLPR